MKEKERKKLIYFKDIIEFLVVVYFLVGGIDKFVNPLIQYADYILSILIQLYVLIYLLVNEEVRVKAMKKIVRLYFINMILITTIMLHFFQLNTGIIEISRRILPLYSIFGFVIVFGISTDYFINLDRIIKKIVYGYFFIGCSIIIDACIFVLFKTSLWPPEYYLGARFSGPFYDSNFLGLYYGILLLIVLYYGNIDLKYRKSIIIIFALNLLISLSWTNIGIFIIAVILNKFIKFKNILLKQVLFISLYLFIIYIFSLNQENLKIAFIDLLSKITSFSEKQLLAKFLSFEYRIEAQLKALDLFKYDMMGAGPRMIVPLIGRDVHNSFVGFLFELGIPGILLLMGNFNFKFKDYNKCLDILSTYIILMALTLNVHYSVIYTLVLMLIIVKYTNEKKKMKVYL